MPWKGHGPDLARLPVSLPLASDQNLQNGAAVHQETAFCVHLSPGPVFFVDADRHNRYDWSETGSPWRPRTVVQKERYLRAASFL